MLPKFAKICEAKLAGPENKNRRFLMYIGTLPLIRLIETLAEHFTPLRKPRGNRYRRHLRSSSVDVAWYMYANVLEMTLAYQ